MADIILGPLLPEDREQFILDNQEAFNYGPWKNSTFGTTTLKRRNHLPGDDRGVHRRLLERLSRIKGQIAGKPLFIRVSSFFLLICPE